MDYNIMILKQLEDKLKDGIEVIVHSIFNNSINILCDERMYVLQAEGFYITPMSCICKVSLDIFEKIKDNIRFGIRFINKKLYIGNLEFDIKILDKNLKIDKICKNDNLKKFFNVLETKLDIYDFDGALFNSFKVFRNNNEIESNKIVSKYFLNQLEFITSNQFDIKKLENFIGVGEGLTPSGDDFICGYIASLFFLGEYEKINILNNLLIEQLNKTTRVSQEYLYYALNGKFNEYVRQINDICNCNDFDNYILILDKVIENIIKIGHSSGIDFLIGLYFGLMKEGK